jgi:hypothetical protein
MQYFIAHFVSCFLTLTINRDLFRTNLFEVLNFLVTDIVNILRHYVITYFHNSMIKKSLGNLLLTLGNVNPQGLFC